MADAWGVQEVCHWLERIGLAQYQGTFRANAVDGTTLLSITAADLKTELEIPVLRDRKVLLAAIDALRQPTSEARDETTATTTSLCSIPTNRRPSCTASQDGDPISVRTPAHAPMPDPLPGVQPSAFPEGRRRSKFDGFDKEAHMQRTREEIQALQGTPHRPSTSGAAREAPKASYGSRGPPFGKVDYTSILTAQGEDAHRLQQGKQQYEALLKRCGF
eukprot:EG_transcript_22583